MEVLNIKSSTSLIYYYYYYFEVEEKDVGWKRKGDLGVGGHIVWHHCFLI